MTTSTGLNVCFQKVSSHMGHKSKIHEKSEKAHNTNRSNQKERKNTAKIKMLFFKKEKMK